VVAPWGAGAPTSSRVAAGIQPASRRRRRTSCALASTTGLSISDTKDSGPPRFAPRYHRRAVSRGVLRYAAAMLTETDRPAGSRRLRRHSMTRPTCLPGPARRTNPPAWRGVRTCCVAMLRAGSGR
jgi:hypothetical protein